MHEPRRREDPIFHPFVVVTVRRIRREDPIVDRPRKCGPILCLWGLAHESVRSDAETGDRDERVVLTVRIALTRLGFEEFIHQMSLLHELVAVLVTLRRRDVVVE